MPTAPKLAAAILFGLLGGVLAVYVPRLLPAGTPLANLLPVAVIVFALAGWRLSGAQATPRSSQADVIGTGIRTAVLAAFAVLFLCSALQMLRLAFKMRYDGALEAVVGIFAQMVRLVPFLIDLPFAALLLGGGALAGMLTGAVGRRWR